MRLKIIIVTLLISVLLAACNGNSTNEESKDNETIDIKELVQDYSTGEVTNQTASITSTQLVVTENDDNETVYDLPEEEFFVSIAPFINATHPCTDHSLTGCQGELVDKDFGIYIEDMEGNVILDEKMNSESNGFVDLWLPRDKTYHVKITHEGRTVESEISTFKNDGTCITTMQLT
ncbi:CueP family metal-binding protein [Oceanobacillus sp. CF4.6]|uniref:CueP family metal-binding protein n=1 Tax=Oceanobacillus sp. CF4.6 TaxID=3373080 RepID=UPI003EE66095